MSSSNSWLIDFSNDEIDIEISIGSYIYVIMFEKQFNFTLIEMVKYLRSQVCFATFKSMILYPKMVRPLKKGTP